MPKVTILMPVYNSEKYIGECLDSIMTQTFPDWELVIVNEFGSRKVCTDIINEYAERDNRIKVLQNNKRLGLAESLNAGMRMACGEYIARMDADDLMHPDRLSLQVDFMETHNDAAMAGSYQHHFGEDIDWIHKPPTDKEQCKANFLFFCDICHSTLILRKEIFLQNNLFYDNHYLAEDFELWSRVIDYGEVYNIPLVLGEYRVGEDNITNEKKSRLHEESGHITAKTVKRTLGLEIEPEKHYLFNSWKNGFASVKDKVQRKRMYDDLKSVLVQIYEKNRDVRFFEESALLRAIRAKWCWAYCGEPFNRMVDVVNNDIESIFKTNYSNMYINRRYVNRFYYFWKDNKGVMKKIKKITAKVREAIAGKENV